MHRSHGDDQTHRAVGVAIQSKPRACCSVTNYPNGRHQIVIDERANDTQQNALETIVSGEACEPLSNHFSVFGSLCTEFCETLFLPIELDVNPGERTAEARIPGVLRSTASPIINDSMANRFTSQSHVRPAASSLRMGKSGEARPRCPVTSR